MPRASAASTGARWRPRLRRRSVCRRRPLPATPASWLRTGPRARTGRSAGTPDDAAGQEQPRRLDLRGMTVRANLLAARARPEPPAAFDACTAGACRVRPVGRRWSTSASLRRRSLLFFFEATSAELEALTPEWPSCNEAEVGFRASPKRSPRSSGLRYQRRRLNPCVSGCAVAAACTQHPDRHGN